jgi:hypothetical protein
VIVRRKDMKKEDSKDNEGLFGPEIAPHFKKNLCYLRFLLFDLLLLRRGAVFYLERGSRHHLVGGTAKSDGRAMAAIC